jgi:hypothetical protein
MTEAERKLWDQLMNSMTTTLKKDAPVTDKKTETVTPFKNVGVAFVDSPDKPQILLPQGMTYEQARTWITKIEQEETRLFQFQYTFKGWFPLDAMWAMYRALVEMHGFAHVADNVHKTMFGEVKTPPAMITIEIGYGQKQQIPWGPIEVNSFSAPLTPSIDLDQGVPVLVFNAKIRNNEREQADKLMKRAEQMLRESSIYKGRAVEADFEVVSPMNFRFDPTKSPIFWDTSGTRPEELILPKSVAALVQTSILTPIEKADLCRAHQIPLRRGILLAGSYGVGKTLTARLTAKKCEDNGWTFLYLKQLNQLPQALKFAKRYEPCVVFAEDVNRVVSGDRDQAMDDLFNLIDGVDRKNDEVMVVFTTNNIEEIHAGMLRPGRIDTVITVTPPDADAVRRLIRLYGRELLDPSANLQEVGEMLAGQIPAIVREAVERSKLTAISDAVAGQGLVVKDEHLVVAARQMLVHAELLKEPPEPAPDLQILGEAIGKTIAAGFRETLGHRFDADGDYIYDDDKGDIREGLSDILDDAGRPSPKKSNGHTVPQG